MTIEQLEKANEIQRKLKERKEFLIAFDSKYCNLIRAIDYIGGVIETTKHIVLDNELGLSELIREYIVNQIADLEKQLEEL